MVKHKIKEEEKKREADEQAAKQSQVFQENQMQQISQKDESDYLLDKLSNIIKDKKSKILDRNIQISDVQEALLSAYKEYYSEEKLLKYQQVVAELTQNQKDKKLSKVDSTKLSNHIKYLREQEYTKEMLDILNQELISPEDAAKVLLPFADPTLDVSFKMLFGQDENRDILISLLNSFRWPNLSRLKNQNLEI